jgi:transposase
MALEILKITKIDVCLLGTLIVSLAYQVRKNQIVFKLQLEEFVKLMRWLCPHLQVELWTSDEARLGLKPIIRRTWALKGQRPIALHHPRYKWLYTYGFVHPKTGESCLFILPRVNIPAMQIALESFADQANPQNEKLIILLVDRAGWHVSSKLKVPKNIIMYPIPAYTPRLNPTECIWPLLRESLANKPLNDLDESENILVKRCNWLMNNPQIVKGAAGFKWLSKL